MSSHCSRTMQATLNPIDVTQWEFFLLQAAILDQHVEKQR
jgi:hypothetical protein